MIEKKRAEEFMNIQKKYGNYELHPKMKIDGYEKEIWDEKTEIIEELKRAVREKRKKQKKCILAFDLYPGVRKEEIFQLAEALQPDCIFDTEKRYGSYPQNKWDFNIRLMHYFEEKMDRDI